MLFANQFPVAGRTIVVTGGSQGMGLEVARQLAQKGANIVIVARSKDKLAKGLEYVSQGASTETQRFLQVSADLTSPAECVRVVDEVEAWNSGSPPDIVWCCAGTSQPGLFVDTPVERFQSQMNSNYFVNMYMAHAILNRWLKKTSTAKDAPSGAVGPDRHLIFTASFAALYTFIGYTPYSPAKAALRSLSDTLSQELNLYAAANPQEPRVRLHTIFPSGIISEGYEQENLIKPDVTKMIEVADVPQTPADVASKSIAGLESGLELITTDFQSRLVRCSVMGGSTRGGFIAGFLDWIIAGFMAFVMVIVRQDMDSKVRKWGSQHGSSGMKTPVADKTQS